MAARMVELPASSSRRLSGFMEDALHAVTAQGIDDNVLLAFQRGAQQHVEKSMEGCRRVCGIAAARVFAADRGKSSCSVGCRRSLVMGLHLTSVSQACFSSRL